MLGTDGRISGIEVRFRANFAYVDGRQADGTVLQLCRLRYGGSTHHWGFTPCRASHDDYEDAVLPSACSLGGPRSGGMV